MIEAVNSVLSNASSNRAAVEVQTSTRSFAANPEKTQEAARAPYVSPAISIDKQSNKAIIQIRDSDTGDVLQQFPTEGQLKAYRTAQQFSERQREEISSAVREASVGESAPSIPSAAPSNEVSVPSVSETSDSSNSSVNTEA